MKVIIAGGGTGGHIYPAIAIGEKIKEENPDNQVIFVGTRDGLERQLISQRGLALKFIEISGFHRKKIWKNIKTGTRYLRSKREMKQWLREISPDKVIGTGGYVSAPVVKAAQSLGIDTYIQEQNAVPGLANKVIAPKAKKIFLGFEEAADFFQNKDNQVVTGNPIRESFFQITREEARKRLKISPERKVILVLGGSRGAGRINKAAMELMGAYNHREDVEIFWVTGQRYYEGILHELAEENRSFKEHIHMMEYIKDMPLYLNGADLVVSRSGAITLSEITACGKASILIPSPNVTGNHQMINAKALENQEGAVILREEDLLGDRLKTQVDFLIKDDEKRNQMGENARRYSRKDTLERIYYHLTH